ncbi:lantibiotic dehydratase [Streptosporangium sp. CA-135522]|uniref:lantibiotic dehydratase n=1 Tax=Streptosporangium sp. CA-135522 TaxID=3240072 RepID=UPI003D8B1285
MTPFRPAKTALLRSPVRGAEDRLTDQAHAGELDRAACVRLLRRAAGDDLLMEALKVASPSLAGLVADPHGRKTAQLRRAALAVIRYELRMRSRPTPFGLFAGVATARFGPAAKVSWSEPGTTRTRVDLSWLLHLVAALQSDREVLAQLAVRTHTGLTFSGGRVFMTQHTNAGLTAGQEARSELSIRDTSAVRAAFELAEDGVHTGELLAELGRRYPQADPEAIGSMVSSLVDQEFLITGLRPCLDDTDPLNHVIGVLAGLHRPPAMLPRLREIAAAREAYDRCLLDRRSAALEVLQERMRALHRSDHLLHVDLRLGADVHLPEEVAAEAARAAGVLWRLLTPRLAPSPLREYHEEFVERYGTERLVPVRDLLNEGTGLGPPAGYDCPAGPRPAPAYRGERRESDRLLARLVAEAVRDRASEIVLDEELVARIEPEPPDPSTVPRSVELYLSLVAASVDDLADGRFRLSVGPNPGSPEAGATFGRFAGLVAVDEIAAECRAADTGELRLNVACQPRYPRSANVGHGPSWTGHRISIGVPPDPAAIEISADDLAIGAEADRLYAVHLPTGRRVVPTSATMLDPVTQAPNLARFLLEVGFEGRRMWAPWDWITDDHHPYVPRVRYGRTVLSPAKWRLDELGGHAAAPPREWARLVGEWRERWSVPRHIVLTDFDHRLSLDLDNPWHLEVLRDDLRKKDSLVAWEPPGGADRVDGWLRDGEGLPHLAELAVPLFGDVREPAPPVAAVDRALPSRRLHPPGGEWLYLKLYGPARHVDSLLCEHLAPLLTGADRWFFVRYLDPAPHLRLRLRGSPALLWGELLPRFRAAADGWLDRHLVDRVALDTYDPEWERYGGREAMECAERLFHADSEAVTALLALERSRRTREDLVTLGAVVLASLADAFGRELPGGAWAFPGRFRPRREALLRLVDPGGGWPYLGEDLLEILRPRADVAREYGSRVRALGDASEDRILASLLHMTCNRLFGTDREREREAHALAGACVLGNLNRRRHGC